MVAAHVLEEALAVLRVDASPDARELLRERPLDGRVRVHPREEEREPRDAPHVAARRAVGEARRAPGDVDERDARALRERHRVLAFAVHELGAELIAVARPGTRIVAMRPPGRSRASSTTRLDAGRREPRRGREPGAPGAEHEHLAIPGGYRASATSTRTSASARRHRPSRLVRLRRRGSSAPRKL